jgi:hypothetical protein
MEFKLNKVPICHQTFAGYHAKSSSGQNAPYQYSIIDSSHMQHDKLKHSLFAEILAKELLDLLVCAT